MNATGPGSAQGHSAAAAPVSFALPPATASGSSSKGSAAGPLRGWRARLQRWFESRLPLADSVTLTQRNVYILPTRPGWMLALTLLVLLVASINYQLNLGYLLTFLLAGCATVGMHVCHGTLRGLNLSLLAPESLFARRNGSFQVQLASTRRRSRYGIGVSLLGSAQWVWCDVPGQGSSRVEVSWQPPARGLHRLPTLTAETRFPMGTFRVWTVWRPAAQVLVYPAPEQPCPPLPPGQPHSSGASLPRALRSNEEYDGVRAYRRGDPLKQVVWKKVAKTGQMVSRDGEQALHQMLWLDFDQTAVDGALPALGTEAKLARLCAWAVQADALGLVYGLRLPGQQIAPSGGAPHLRQCLQALALA